VLDSMLSRLADVLVLRRKAVLITTAVLVVLSAIVGSGVFGRLGSEGFDDPASESSRAAQLISDRFGPSYPGLVLVVSARGSENVDSTDVASAGTDISKRVAAIDGVGMVISYWTAENAPALRSTDSKLALITVVVNHHDDDVASQVMDEFDGRQGPVDVSVGGALAVNDQVSSFIQEDLARAEFIAVPITMVLLVLIFGSFTAALLPLLIGGISIAGTFLVLDLVSRVTDVSVFSINLITGLGMGLGIDYALLVVSRFREELASGITVDEAVHRTVRSTGRTIVFSGLTVALALSSMLVFPLYFLRSFAYAGVAVVLLAVLAAVVTLPALLAVLGPKVDSLAVLKRSVKPSEDGLWGRTARRIMRPGVAVITAVAVTLVLVLLGLPFLRAQWGQVDERALPTTASTRLATELQRANFTGQQGASVSIVLPDTAPNAIADYAVSISRLNGVAEVDSAAGSYTDGQKSPQGADPSQFISKQGGTWLRIIPTDIGIEGQGAALVRELRALPAPGHALVGGNGAVILDTKAVLGARLPWALAIVAIFTAILLFLFTGSLVVPIKALVLNTLSLSATFGAMVWIFQDGHLSGLLNFTPTGSLDMSIPILMFCVAFGLSMDYEVFLLARIKEEYDRTGDNTLAVVHGMQRTGRIITAAASLLAIVFLAFATSRVTNIKLMGLGIAVAVVMDATLVRGLLVPAFMRLAGKWNWWAPKPLRAIYGRFGLSEVAD
jgi:RND superfamily putative drug exporter